MLRKMTIADLTGGGLWGPASLLEESKISKVQKKKKDKKKDERYWGGDPIYTTKTGELT